MQELAGSEPSSKDCASDVSFFEGRQTISEATTSSEMAGPGLTMLGVGLSVSCNFPTGGEVRVIAGDGALVTESGFVGDFDGDPLIGKRKLMGLG
jgi:hypothetical protein